MNVRSVAASVGILVASLTAAAPATAVAWGTAGNPVYGTDGGKAFGKMYGNFYNDRSIQASSTTYQYDLQPNDGNNVRVETDFSFFRPCISGQPASWCFDVSKQTVETHSASWVRDERSRYLRQEASAVRGGINICEVQRFSNDPCSPHAIPQFSY